MFIKHHITQVDLDLLEAIFAELTAEGWVLPAWLSALRRNA